MSGELRFHILLIEDNDADIYLSRKALETADLKTELTIVQNSAEALAFVLAQGKHAARQLPDLAVLDLSLPKHQGAGDCLEEFLQIGEMLRQVLQNRNVRPSGSA